MTDVSVLPDDDDLLAAELALDLLDAPERAAAVRREADDATFAALAGQWRARATGLLAGEAMEPPAWLWRSIAASLPANDTGEVWRWRVATGVAAAAALVLGAVALRPAAPPPRPAVVAPAPAPLLAMLSGEKSRAVVTVMIDRAARRMTMVAAGLSTPGHSAELWVIADGVPISLGVVDPAAPRRVSPPAAASEKLGAGATLAVSVEPRGGSPTGKPTGPVILTGVVGAS